MSVPFFLARFPDLLILISLKKAVLRLIARLFAGETTPARAWFGPVLVIGVAHPEDMQTVLSSTQCLQKGYMYKFIHNQSGLFTADGRKRERERERIS